MTNQEINEAVAQKFDLYRRNGEMQDRAFLREDFVHDITAAWKIVEEVFAFKLVKNPTDWFCQLLTREMASKGQWPLEAMGETAPMAICLAFLKLP